MKLKDITVGAAYQTTSFGTIEDGCLIVTEVKPATSELRKYGGVVKRASRVFGVRLVVRDTDDNYEPVAAHVTEWPVNREGYTQASMFAPYAADRAAAEARLLADHAALEAEATAAKAEADAAQTAADALASTLSGLLGRTVYVERMVGGVRVRLDTADAHTVTAAVSHSMLADGGRW